MAHMAFLPFDRERSGGRRISDRAEVRSPGVILEANVQGQGIAKLSSSLGRWRRRSSRCDRRARPGPEIEDPNARIH